MARTGRPSKLNPTVAKRITDAIAGGNTRAVAAVYGGIDKATLFQWMAKGRIQERGEYRDFLDLIEKAEAEAVVAAVTQVRLAARTTWQAAAWWLERRFPDEWGRKDRVELSGLLKSEAEKIAEEFGVSAEDVVADAERILAGSR